MDNIENTAEQPPVEQQNTAEQPPAGTPTTPETPAVTGAAPEQAPPTPDTSMTLAGVTATAVPTEAADVAAAFVSGAVATVTGEAERVRAHLHAIETQALAWGGEVGVAIRNEVCALMDHLGVPRQH